MLAYLRQIPPGVRDRVAGIIHYGWGYPREITEPERAGWWLSYGDEECILGVGWLEPGPDEGDVTLHACRRPDGRVDLGTGVMFQKLEVVAELVGARRIVALLGPENPRGRALRRYFRARGWQEEPRGMYRLLGTPEAGGSADV